MSRGTVTCPLWSGRGDEHPCKFAYVVVEGKCLRTKYPCWPTQITWLSCYRYDPVSSVTESLCYLWWIKSRLLKGRNSVCMCFFGFIWTIIPTNAVTVRWVTPYFIILYFGHVQKFHEWFPFLSGSRRRSGLWVNLPLGADLRSVSMTGDVTRKVSIPYMS